MAKLADASALGADGETRRGSNPLPPMGFGGLGIKDSSGSNSVVECNLAKVEVEGSNPFSRSMILEVSFMGSK